jgi:hypothetical protein
MKNVYECGSECRREREGKNSKNGVFGLQWYAKHVVAKRKTKTLAGIFTLVSTPVNLITSTLTVGCSLAGLYILGLR